MEANPIAARMNLLFLFVTLLLGACSKEPVRWSNDSTALGPDKILGEHLVTIRTLPKFEARRGEDYETATLARVEGKAVTELSWSGYPVWREKLPKDREVTFTVWLAKHYSSHASGEGDFYWDCEVETIRDGQELLYDAAVCHLHGVRMERTDISIQYGLPVGEFLEAFKTFSGGPGFTLGGCVVSSFSPKTQRGYKCSECVAAYERWGKEFHAKREALRKGDEPGKTG